MIPYLILIQYSATYFEEKTVLANSEKEARALVWNSLRDEQKDSVECLEVFHD